nr:unnamed protein product [Callosobruchus chinensis]
MEQYGRSKVALPYNHTLWKLKTLEFTFSKSQAEVYVYKRDKISRRKTDAGQTQSSRLGQVKVNNHEGRPIKIGKIQKGDLLLEVRKGKAEDLKTAINNQMHGVQAAGGPSSRLHLSNLDSITTKEDIITRCRVTSIRPAYGESQNATVIADIDVARLQLKKSTLLIGLIRCPVKERELRVGAGKWGMIEKNASPNRADLCFKCAKPGHKGLRGRSLLPLYNKPGHRMARRCVGSTSTK